MQSVHIMMPSTRPNAPTESAHCDKKTSTGSCYQFHSKFFDGFDTNVIEKAYTECPRLSACMKEMGALQSIQQWEERRPDTFN
jgi:hypothetical protein